MHRRFPMKPNLKDRAVGERLYHKKKGAPVRPVRPLSSRVQPLRLEIELDAELDFTRVTRAPGLAERLVDVAIRREFSCRHTIVPDLAPDAVASGKQFDTANLLPRAVRP